MPWSCLRAASQAETQADRTHASRKPESPCDTELGRTTSDTPLDRSCIGLMRVLANGSKVLTGWSSRMANCFCFGLTLCIYSEEMHAWAELCRLGHGPRAEAIVAHPTARVPLVSGAELGLRCDSMATRRSSYPPRLEVDGHGEHHGRTNGLCGGPAPTSYRP